MVESGGVGVQRCEFALFISVKVSHDEGTVVHTESQDRTSR